MLRALILADATGRRLAPLSDRACPALMTIAGKTLLDYALDDLLRAGVQQALVAIGAAGATFEDALRRATAAGLACEPVVTGGDANPWRLLARLGLGPDGETLVVRADVLRSALLGDLLFAAAARPEAAAVSAVAGGIPAGAVVIRRGGGQLDDGWTPGESVPLDGSRAIPVDSPIALHRANLEVAAGLLAGVAMPSVALPPGVCIEEPVWVAAGATIDPGARLGPNVVIAEGCHVDYEANLRSTVVMPDTYVGERLELSDALVWGDVVVDLTSGETRRLRDRMLVADLSGKRRSGRSQRPRRWAPRAALRSALQLVRPTPATSR